MGVDFFFRKTIKYYSGDIDILLNKLLHEVFLPYEFLYFLIITL